MIENHNVINIEGAQEHNLKNISLKIPRDKLVVVTGVSGSGKSSLAFDTIYAEGQRRYIETFNAYARQFLGGLERPNVDKIDGLSPVIAIEQKTNNKSPRSTVGTITEIYDFMRLLFAKTADAYSLHTGKKMVKYSEDQILKLILKDYEGKKISILTPIIKARKGHYRELLQKIAKKGFVKARIDNEITDLTYGMKLNRYKTHDIDIVVDRLKISDDIDKQRLKSSIQTAMREGGGSLIVLEEGNTEGRYFSKNLMCKDTGISYNIPDPNSFSFNSPKGYCTSCNGIGIRHEISLEKIIPDDSLSITQGGIIPVGTDTKSWIYGQLIFISKKYKFKLSAPIKSIPEEAMKIILYGGKESFEYFYEDLGISKKHTIDFKGIANFIYSEYDSSKSYSIKKWALNFLESNLCKECNGSRLQKNSLYFKIHRKNIFELSEMDLEELAIWFKDLPQHLTKTQKQISSEIVKEINTRIQFLLDVGLEYLSLSRGANTLSGGESQRIRLATQIGTQLVGVLYILDEPSIGLHQRDNEKLINSLVNLRDIGNSIIVVEHDKDIMLKSDHVIDIGPKAGKNGGHIVFEGTPEQMMKTNTSTSSYLNLEKRIVVPKERRKGNKKFLELKGCQGNNLKNINIKIPLNSLIVVTGVSGSGKSTLINETLYPILNTHFFRAHKKPQPYKSIKGLDDIDKVIGINQSPIGRTPRSNPATYTGVLSDIRNLFSQTIESQIRGYKPGRFSFNVVGGRCETCKGGGIKLIEMNFLPDIYVDCETCNGKRFNRETLEVRYRGKSISDVLEMTVNEAVTFFEAIPKIYRIVKTLQDVGLGYITLGQQSTTLSGGEAQRVKLASELSKKDTGNTLYILDEPTTGLHFEDIDILMKALNKLVDKGNTIIIIEHNLDVIKLADHIIDIGPEAGKNGGEIVACGTPEEVIKVKKGHTIRFLKEALEE